MSMGAYSKAMLELAFEERAENSIYKELKDIDMLYRENPDFVKLLDAPDISKAQRAEIVKKVFDGRVHKYTLNLLRIMSERGISHSFCELFKEFQSQYRTKKGIAAVRAYTAVPLKPNQRERLKEKLKSVIGKEIELENKIDPKVLGGILIKYDNAQIDGSIRTRFEDMKKKLLAKTI